MHLRAGVAKWDGNISSSLVISSYPNPPKFHTFCSVEERNFQVYFSRVLSVLVSNPVENNKYSHVIVIVTSADPVIVTLAGHLRVPHLQRIQKDG